MLARVRRWWAARSGIERVVVAIGVPVAAIAALWGARQDRARKEAAAEDAEGGPGAEAATVRGPSVINAGAPGVATSDLASFSEAFAGEIGSLEQSVAGLEDQFGKTAAERAKADADRQAQIEDLTETVEGVERATTKAGQRVSEAERIARRAYESTVDFGEPGWHTAAKRFEAIWGYMPSRSSTVAEINFEVRRAQEDPARWDPRHPDYVER